jgi:hypothetical protein
MKRNKKHKNKDLENFLDYSSGQMTGRERHLFEKDLQKDPFESDAAEGLSSLSREEARQDMKELKNRLSSRTGTPIIKSNRFVLYRAAAAVAAILIVGTLIILLTSDLSRVFDKAAVTENKRSDKENIKLEEKSEQVIPEESLNESVVPATSIPAVSKTETVTVSEPLETEIVSEIIAEEDKIQITGGIEKQTGTREDAVIISVEEQSEEMAEEVAMPVMMAKKSETSDEGKIITRKYVDNYVRGVVLSSEDQLPLPGATVKIRGTTAGTYTDKNGNFELAVQPDAEITLVAEYIGMEQNEVSLKDTDEVKITLEPSASELDEVVIIGYGVQQKSKITGAISTLEMDDTPDYQLPSPVTGNRKFKEYIQENLRYPSDDTTGERAIVVLNFVVAGNGRPKNISVLKSPGQSFSEEAIRLLVSGPDWYPAKRDGEIIEEETMIRIVFKLEYK